MRKREGYEIKARCLSYKIPVGGGGWRKIWRSDEAGGERHVLQDVWCRARPREILAVMGPSGAGKSTLLRLLAGRLPAPPCSILVNDRPVGKTSFLRRISALVPQTDSLFPLLTVGETVAFSARMRLGLSGALLGPRVEALLADLHLSHVTSRCVGSVSGGELRRVSIAVEAVGDPAVMVLDEPTCGLDSASALQIVGLLRFLAESGGRTVVLSIHQPCSRIVSMFGSLLLLSQGKVLHQGGVPDLVARLASAGSPLPPHANPVEFAITAIARLSDRAHAPDRSTLHQLEFPTSDQGDEDDADAQHCRYANGPAMETVILALRFAKSVSRTKELYACRTAQMLLAGLVLGSIFYDLKPDVGGARDRAGLFAFILTFLLSCTAAEALPLFLREREVLEKETSCGAYRVSSYVLANAAVFLPFLLLLALLFALPLYWLANLRRSAASFAFFVVLVWLVLCAGNSVVLCFSSLAPDFVVGNSLVAGAMGSFFLFSGYFIRKEGMPACWLFMNYLSLFKYPFEAFLLTEFGAGETCFQTHYGACVLRGTDLLIKEGFAGASRWTDVAVILAFILAYRFCAYIILTLKFK